MIQNIFVATYITCLFFLSSIRAENTPVITGLKPHQVAITGDTVEFSCTVRNFDPDELQWQKETREGTEPELLFDGKQRNITDTRISVTNNANSILRIENIEINDAGIYRCLIPLTDDNFISMDVLLEIRKPPSFNGNSTPDDVTFEENQEIELKCYADGIPQPTVSWIRETGLLPHNLITYEGNILHIENIQKNHSGIYRCTADNKIGVAIVKTIQVNVRDKLTTTTTGTKPFYINKNTSDYNTTFRYTTQKPTFSTNRNTNPRKNKTDNWSSSQNEKPKHNRMFTTTYSNESWKRKNGNWYPTKKNYYPLFYYQNTTKSKIDH